MNRLSKILLIIIYALIVLIIVQFLILRNKGNNDKAIKGISVCTSHCSMVDVKTVYTGSNIEVSENNVYGGNMSPQICTSVGESYTCKELDISKIADYKQVTRVIGTVPQSFPNFVYINKHAESRGDNKVYFLYRILSDTLSKWVYDDPLVIISYDTTNGTVKNEGQLSVSGLNVKNMTISPKGSYILVTDAFNPRYLPTQTTSSMVLYNLKNKETKVLEEVGDGGWFNFITWIDDSHFFYSENSFTGNSALYKFESINND